MVKAFRKLGRRFLDLTPDRWRRCSCWLQDPLTIIALVWGGLSLLNFGLTLIMTLGMVVAIAVYLAQLNRLYVNWIPVLDQSNDQGFLATFCKITQYWKQLGLQLWPRLWSSANRPLTLALLIGFGCMVFGSSLYLIYQATRSLILVGMIGWQAVAIAIISGWLWQQRQAESDQPAAQSNPNALVTPVLSTSSGVVDYPKPLTTLWVELASPFPPTRLAAVYRIIDYQQNDHSDEVGQQSQLSTSDKVRIMTCLRLMLGNETHPALRQALQDALMLFQENSLLPGVSSADSQI